MEEELVPAPDVTTDEWANRTARSLSLAYTASTWLFAGAALALVLAIVGAVALARGVSGTESVTDMFRSGSSAPFTISQMASMVLGGLLPAGLLAAAGVALRLQAARFEAEFVD